MAFTYRWPMQRERLYDDPTLARTEARVPRHDAAGPVLGLIKAGGPGLQPCGGCHHAGNRRIAFAFAGIDRAV